MRVLLIEDREIHAIHTRRRLAKVGMDVTLCSDARTGIETAKQLLNLAFAPQVDLILLDWLLPHPQSPSLDAMVVAAELVRCMDEGEIHPVHIIVLTQDPSDERREDALSIGCSAIFEKPLSVDAAQTLYVHAQTVPHYPLKSPGYQRILRLIRPTLEMLYAGQESTAAFHWTRKSIKRLLEANVINEMTQEEQSWIRQNGGFEAIKVYVNTIYIADSKLDKLRLLLINNPDAGWEWLMRELGTNKNYVYDYKNMLFDILASSLNRLIQSSDSKHRLHDAA